MNKTETHIVPDMPNVVPNQQINVYIPVVSNYNSGIAKFLAEQFTVSDGLVRIKDDYLKSLFKDYQTKYDPSLNTKTKVVSEAINECNNVANNARNIAQSALEAVPKVYFEEGFTLLVGMSLYNPIKNGDILINLARNTPDFLVFEVGSFSTSNSVVLTEDMIINNTLPVPKVGDTFLLQPVDGGNPVYGIIAIESGGVTATIAVDTEFNKNSDNAIANSTVATALEILNSDIGHVEDVAEEASSIAKGANQALSFVHYSDVIDEFNIASADKYRTGQNIMVLDMGVPDLWVSGVMENSLPFEYTDDSAIVEQLVNPDYRAIRVGHYYISALETQKVDLTNYATKDEVGTKVLVAGEEVTEFNADTKLNIRTESSTYNQVYAKLTNGTQAMLPVATAGTTAANAIPRYSTTKQLATETPTASNHAANKQYVDDLVGDIATALTDLHTYAMSLKGGEA